MDLSEGRVEHILRVHQRIPCNLRGQCYRCRFECTRNLLHSLSPGSSRHHPMLLGKPLDPPTSSANLDEPRRAVPMWRGLLELSADSGSTRYLQYLEPTRLCC